MEIFKPYGFDTGPDDRQADIGILNFSRVQLVREVVVASGDDNKEPQWFKEERGYTAHEFPGELFNLREDIAERTNLYGKYPDLVRELSELLAQIRGTA